MTPTQRATDIALRLSVVAGLWTLTSVLFYRIETALGTDNGYNDAPILFALFYATACLIPVVLYRRSYLEWSARNLPPADYWPGLVMAAVFATFAIFVLGLLPAIDWQAAEPLPDLLAATPWYFLPKSTEILFQQVLITTLIVGFHHLGLPLRTTALVIALTFGAVHLSLALEGKDPFYVARYTIAATAFGYVVPYLQSRWRNGFALSYGLHWSFYAADVTVAHLIG
jgi:hypothetical protein